MLLLIETLSDAAYEALLRNPQIRVVGTVNQQAPSQRITDPQAGHWIEPAPATAAGSSGPDETAPPPSPS